MNRALAHAAEATPALRGRRVRVLRAGALAWAALLAGPALVGAALLLGGPTMSVAAWAYAGALLLGLRAYVRSTLGANRLCSAGAAALAVDDLDGADAAYAALATERHVRGYTALALHGLSCVALRRGRGADAVTLARAALGCRGDREVARRTAAPRALLRAQLAVALACEGALEEAGALLAAPPDPGATAHALATHAWARALVACRRDRFADALALLDESRALLRNVTAGYEYALVQAMEAAALVRLGGVYRGGARAAHAVLPYDDSVRAFVARLLPGAEAHLPRG